MNKVMLDNYVNYLLVSTGQVTATGLSKIFDGAVSHDQVSRFLSSQEFSSVNLWEIAKPLVRKIENKDNGVLILDSTIVEKDHSKENDVICWHFDHSKGRFVKGIEIVLSVYSVGGSTIPVFFDVTRKTEAIIDPKTGKEKRVSLISKNQAVRDMMQQAVENGLLFKYVLMDSWFSSAENMTSIRDMGKEFVLPVKTNRRAALSKKDKAMGRFVRIDSIESGENTLVWLPGVSFPLRFVRQVFKNGDGVTGVLHLLCSDIELTNEQIIEIYKKRWKIEVCNKSLKQNASLSKSPTKIPKTQVNHVFASCAAIVKLERLSIETQKNHFAIKESVYLQALKKAMKALSDIMPSGRQEFANVNFA